MNEHTRSELSQMQALPLEAKINATKRRIMDWYDYWEGQVYLSFSGGKDSTVLRHIIESMPISIPYVFVDTGLEYPEVRRFATKHATVILKPELRFDEVIEKYGYPVISKEVSNVVDGARRSIVKGVDSARLKRIQGRLEGKDGGYSQFNCPKYEYLLDAPFKISDKCCDIMKKKPFHLYEKETGFKPITGMMASESRKRLMGWLNTGCNAFDTPKPQSNPMAFWTEQDVLKYIYDFNIDIADVYGDVVIDNDEYKTTGVNRTGCMFCLFGITYEEKPNRMQLMAKTHPRQYEYCMNQLGIKNVLDYISVEYEGSEKNE